jgi:penicillin amidase
MRLPLIGRRYLVGDFPVGGSNETLMKSRHGFVRGRHKVGFGAQARHIFDLSDLDANHFVLLGGQDGWLGSTTFADHLPLWRRGELIRVPMRARTVRAEHPNVTVLTPPVRRA